MSTLELIVGALISKSAGFSTFIRLLVTMVPFDSNSSIAKLTSSLLLLFPVLYEILSSLHCLTSFILLHLKSMKNPFSSCFKSNVLVFPTDV